jgi:hypothetical protein
MQLIGCIHNFTVMSSSADPTTIASASPRLRVKNFHQDAR